MLQSRNFGLDSFKIGNQNSVWNDGLGTVPHDFLDACHEGVVNCRNGLLN